MILTALEAYKTFQAMKLHFSSDSFDFHRYHGKTKIDPSSFMAKKDKLFYYKIAKKVKKEDFEDFVLANILAKDNLWIKDLIDEDAEVAFMRHRKKIQSLSYVFEQEVLKIFAECREKKIDGRDLVLVSKEGDHPILLKFYWEKLISLETIIILDMLLDFTKTWNENITDDLLWPKTYKLMRKYGSFFDLDKKKYKNILTLALKNATI